MATALFWYFYFKYSTYLAVFYKYNAKQIFVGTQSVLRKWIHLCFTILIKKTFIMLNKMPFPFSRCRNTKQHISTIRYETKHQCNITVYKSLNTSMIEKYSTEYQCHITMFKITEHNTVFCKITKQNINAVKFVKISLNKIPTLCNNSKPIISAI